MSRFSRFDLIEHFPFPPFESFFSTSKTLALTPYFPPFSMEDELDLTLDLLHPTPPFDFPSRFDDFDVVTDLIQVKKTPFYTASRRVQRRRADHPAGLSTDPYLKALSDRVSALELSLPKPAKEKKGEKKEKIGQRKYSWTAEIENPGTDGFDRKYKWIAEIKDGKKKGSLVKNFKYTTEIKSKGDTSPFTRTYTFQSSSGDADDKSAEKEIKDKDKKKKDKNKKSKHVGSIRLVEIQDSSDHGPLILKQAFARRVAKVHGKKKELSPQDAAMLIQMTFRAYLIRRSQALRALRELAIAKNKLKEIRASFHNFSYRRQLSRDAEERQRFTEKIIVLLLTVDAIVGADTMVRSAKKSMVDELEAMLDVVDPQPPGKPLNRRRTFDMPDAAIQKELAEGVAQVVRMLEEDQHASGTSEA